jgi:hypothetical protein
MSDFTEKQEPKFATPEQITQVLEDMRAVVRNAGLVPPAS